MVSDPGRWYVLNLRSLTNLPIYHPTILILTMRSCSMVRKSRRRTRKFGMKRQQSWRRIMMQTWKSIAKITPSHLLKLFHLDWSMAVHTFNSPWAQCSILLLNRFTRWIPLFRFHSFVRYCSSAVTSCECHLQNRIWKSDEVCPCNREDGSILGMAEYPRDSYLHVWCR